MKTILTLILSIFSFFCFAEPQVTHLVKGDNQIDLFGTIHIATPNLYPLPDNVYDNIKTSNALVVEMDITDPTIMINAIQLMAEYGSMDKSISNILSQEQLDKMVEYLGENSLVVMEHFRPWVIAQKILMKRMTELGFTEQGIDVTLLSYAKQQQINIIGLETPEEQLGIFRDMSTEDELAFLNETLVTDSSARIDMLNMISMWLNNDEDIAKNEFIKEMQEYPAFFDALYTQRNHSMAQRIEQLNQEKPHLFVAIGALHLFGDDSVIKLLEQQGYKQIKTP